MVEPDRGILDGHFPFKGTPCQVPCEKGGSWYLLSQKKKDAEAVNGVSLTNLHQKVGAQIVKDAIKDWETRLAVAGLRGRRQVGRWAGGLHCSWILRVCWFCFVSFVHFYKGAAKGKLFAYRTNKGLT